MRRIFHGAAKTGEYSTVWLFSTPNKLKLRYEIDYLADFFHFEKHWDRFSGSAVSVPPPKGCPEAFSISFDMYEYVGIYIDDALLGIDLTHQFALEEGSKHKESYLREEHERDIALSKKSESPFYSNFEPVNFSNLSEQFANAKLFVHQDYAIFEHRGEKIQMPILEQENPFPPALIQHQASLEKWRDSHNLPEFCFYNKKDYS